MYYMLKNLLALVKQEEGQDMVEYAIILGLVSVAAVAFVIATGTSVNSIWDYVADEVASAVPS